MTKPSIDAAAAAFLDASKDRQTALNDATRDADFGRWIGVLHDKICSISHVQPSPVAGQEGQLVGSLSDGINELNPVTFQRTALNRQFISFTSKGAASQLSLDFLDQDPTDWKPRHTLQDGTVVVGVPALMSDRDNLDWPNLGLSPPATTPEDPTSNRWVAARFPCLLLVPPGCDIPHGLPVGEPLPDGDYTGDMVIWYAAIRELAKSHGATGLTPATDLFDVASTGISEDDGAPAPGAFFQGAELSFETQLTSLPPLSDDTILVNSVLQSKRENFLLGLVGADSSLALQPGSPQANGSPEGIPSSRDQIEGLTRGIVLGMSERGDSGSSDPSSAAAVVDEVTLFYSILGARVDATTGVLRLGGVKPGFLDTLKSQKAFRDTALKGYFKEGFAASLAKRGTLMKGAKFPVAQFTQYFYRCLQVCRFTDNQLAHMTRHEMEQFVSIVTFATPRDPNGALTEKLRLESEADRQEMNGIDASKRVSRPSSLDLNGSVGSLSALATIIYNLAAVLDNIIVDFEHAHIYEQLQTIADVLEDHQTELAFSKALALSNDVKLCTCFQILARLQSVFGAIISKAQSPTIRAELAKEDGSLPTDLFRPVDRTTGKFVADMDSLVNYGSQEALCSFCQNMALFDYFSNHSRIKDSQSKAPRGRDRRESKPSGAGAGAGAGAGSAASPTKRAKVSDASSPPSNAEFEAKKASEMQCGFIQNSDPSKKISPPDFLFTYGDKESKKLCLFHSTVGLYCGKVCKAKKCPHIHLEKASDCTDPRFVSGMQSFVDAHPELSFVSGKGFPTGAN